MLAAIEINVCPLGHDALRSGASSPRFLLLVQKPSNDRDGGPAHRDQPSNCGDAGQSKPYPGPLGPKPSPAGWELSGQFRVDVH